MNVPPDLHTLNATTWDEETGEQVDHLAGLREEGLLGAVVWRVKDREIGRDGELHAVYVGGTVVWYDDETVTVVQARKFYGKDDAKVERIAYKDIVPSQNTPATAAQRHKVARYLCKVLGGHKGDFDRWDRRLIGYAAALANR